MCRSTQLVLTFVILHSALASQISFISTKVSIPVRVDLGVMSRCPDALLCEEVFDQVISKVGLEKIDLRLDYIAKCVPPIRIRDL